MDIPHGARTRLSPRYELPVRELDRSRARTEVLPAWPPSLALGDLALALAVPHEAPIP